MDERDLVPEDAPPRALVDELRSRSREPGELKADVVDLERDVVHPRAPLGEKLPHGGLRTARREKLDAAVSETEQCDIGPLLVDRLAKLDLGPEETPVSLDRLLEVLDRDPDVVEPADRHAGDATYRSLSALTTPTASEARDSGSTSPKTARSSSRDSVSFSSSALATRSRSALCLVINLIASLYA